MVNGRLSSRLILFRLLLPYLKNAETILPRVLFRRLSALALTQVLRFPLPPSHIRSQWSHRPLSIQRCRFIPRMLPQVNNRRFRRHHPRQLQAQRRLNSIVMSEVAKEFVIAGCKVTLRFRRSPKDHWMVEGTVSSGEQDHKRMTSFMIDRATDRDVAESRALEKAGELIGNNAPAVEDRKDPVTASPKVPPDIT